MALRGFTRNFKPLEILTEEQVEAIHRGALEVLWVTGVTMEHERALKLLEKNGCKVDHASSRVHFPSGLVEESLRKCPSAFHVRSRDPENSLIMGGNSVYFLPFPGQHTVDLDTWEPRTATRREFYEGVTVLDALPHVHGLWSYTPYFGFEGVPPAMALLESMAGKIRNSTKFITEGYSKGSEKFTIQMAQAVDTEMSVPCLLSPPLTYCYDAIEAAFSGVEAGFPVRISEGSLYGATAPATIAGALVSANANLIGPIVLLQLVSPGARVFVNDFTLPQNMRTGAPGFGDIVVSLHAAAFNQVWRRYGIPRCNGAAIPVAKRIDFQGGYERAISSLLFALSGANFILLHGGISSELTHHPVQAILDDDLAGMVGRFLEGITINDETLAIELIEQVGPIPGHFLNREHTRKWWQREQFVPRSADRLTYPEWINTGKKGCLDYARQRMDEILATHRPTPLTPGQEEDVERILEEARQYYKEKGLISDEEMATYRKSMESPNYPYG